MKYGLIQLRWMRPVRVAMALLVSLVCAPVSLAAPVLATEEADTGAAVAEPLTAPIRTPSTGPALGRSNGPVVVPEASTGNKNLDLLLELQGRPGEEDQRQAAPPTTAAASAAAAALADLRRRAAQKPAPEPDANKPAQQPLEGLGTLDSNAERAQPPERREWTGRPAGAGGGAGFGGGAGVGGGDGGYGDGGRESAGSRNGYEDDNLLRQLPRELMLFLRDNRYWLLGGLAVIGVIGAALQSYSRRP
ncbi:MAG: hypothetical protein JNL87_04865 [Burkholderiaceae bacterium]|nr:hypothetical protein [Burkholderiaceae bacterium]